MHISRDQPKFTLTPNIVVVSTALTPDFALDLAKRSVGELANAITPNWTIARYVVGVEVEVVNVSCALRCLEQPEVAEHVLLARAQ